MNVTDVPHEADAIHAAVERQLAHGRYARSQLFGDGEAGRRIADILARVPLDVEKSLNYLRRSEPLIGC